MSRKRIIVAVPHGFCSGVARALETMDAVLQRVRPPVYCLNEIVHNRQIVDDLRKRGVVFVSRIADVPDAATLLFSAHGVSPDVRKTARKKSLRVIDATCPFVLKVHKEVLRFAEKDARIILIGHRRHEEVVGVAGEAPDRVIVIENEDEARRVEIPDPRRVGVVTQTTLSTDTADRIVAVLRTRFPMLQTPDRRDICYATQNRQRAVQALAAVSDRILVLGSANSSNSRRLVEVADTAGCPALLISRIEDLETLALSAVGTLGIISGASSPECFLKDVLAALAAAGFDAVEGRRRRRRRRRPRRSRGCPRQWPRCPPRPRRRWPRRSWCPAAVASCWCNPRRPAPPRWPSSIRVVSVS